MIRSRYTVFVPDYPKAGEHLFYHTRSQALVLVDDRLRSAIEALPALPQDRKGRASLRKLLRMGLLARSDAQDRATLEAYFRRLKARPAGIEATVLTTYACNFACTYCAEEGVKAAVHMDDETAERAADYIVLRARKRGARTVCVSLYGGEPLLNMKAVRAVLRRTRERAHAAGLTFDANLVTNGALLTPEVVDELASLGVTGVKVTIDGDREHHDARRPFKGGRGSFDLIMRNVEYAVDKVCLNIDGNFDDGNASSFPALMDLLKERGVAAKLNLMGFKPIAEVAADRARLPANAELACVYSRPETAATVVALRKALVERGIPTSPSIGVGMCGMTLGGAQFTIDPTGQLYRCPAFVGHPEFSVGDISSGETAPAEESDPWRRCADCAYVPLCGDGCMYGAYVRYGDARRLNCVREYIEYVVRESLKEQYEESTRTLSAASVGA